MQLSTPQTIALAAAERIRAMTDAGDLPAGQRVNEVHLAEKLQVSRTPLREALNRLVTEQVLESRPRIGFFVKPLCAEELRQLYSVRPILDCAALTEAGAPSAEQIDKLTVINERFSNARGARRRISADNEFHLELIAGCNNDVLTDLIRSMMARTRRYEMAYLSSRNATTQSGAEHGAIISALARGDLSGAVEALRVNLTSGLDPIVSWLSNNS